MILPRGTFVADALDPTQASYGTINCAYINDDVLYYIVDLHPQNRGYLINGNFRTYLSAISARAENIIPVQS